MSALATIETRMREAEPRKQRVPKQSLETSEI
jgi:hypothetical protein